jgi:hypothetical protein
MLSLLLRILKKFGVSMEERLVIYISRNMVEVLNVDTGLVVNGIPLSPFTTSRLLIGEFDPALELIRALITKVRSNRVLKPFLHVIVQPIDLVDGGVSSVEKRTFAELGFQSGATLVLLSFERSSKLSKAEALEILEPRGRGGF